MNQVLFNSLFTQGVTAEQALAYAEWLKQENQAPLLRSMKENDEKVATPLPIVYLSSDKEDLEVLPYLNVARKAYVVGIQLNGAMWCREVMSWPSLDYIREHFLLCVTKELSPMCSTTELIRGIRLPKSEYADEALSFPVAEKYVDLYVPATGDLQVAREEIVDFNQTIKILRDNGLVADRWEDLPYVAAEQGENTTEMLTEIDLGSGEHVVSPEGRDKLIRPVFLIDYSD